MNPTAHPIAHRYPISTFSAFMTLPPCARSSCNPNTPPPLSCRLSVLRFLRALPALATSPRRSRSPCHLQLTPHALSLPPPNPPTPPHLTSSISLVIRSSKPTLLPSAQHTLLPLHVIYSALISPLPSSTPLLQSIPRPLPANPFSRSISLPRLLTKSRTVDIKASATCLAPPSKSEQEDTSRTYNIWI
jgi:hypothetical protein